MSNLNFGNPTERPEAMGQFVGFGCIEGVGEAARALDFPVVSGNVSLYNETMGSGLRRRPLIGGSDSSTTWRRPRPSLSRRRARIFGSSAGRRRPAPGRSALADDGRRGREESAPAAVALSAERRIGYFVASLIRGGKVSPPFTTCPTAALPWRWPRWRWRADLARASRPTDQSTRVLLRRGSGPLRFDCAACRKRGDRRGGEAPRCSPVAHRRDRGRDIEAWRRGCGRPCGARRSI